MTKVFHFDAPRERYESEAAVVWCFDNRFHLTFAKFLKRRGISINDIIKIAGGAQTLASPARETDREFLLNQIRTSIRLHDTKLVILMVHSDCGGYGGLAAFHGDARAEAEHHEKELQRASAYVKDVIPGIAVESYFVDFEGVWAVQVAA